MGCGRTPTLTPLVRATFVRSGQSDAARHHRSDQSAVHLGPLSIRWYQAGYTVAFLVGGGVAARSLAGRRVHRQVTERVIF